MPGKFGRIFKTAKPVIAMVHFGALPGSPLHDAESGLKGLLEGVRTLRRGHLRVAADSATHVMPLLAVLRTRHSGLTFSLKIDNSTNVLKSLLDYGADIGITARNSSDPRIHSILLRKDRLVLFVPTAHPLGRSGPVPLSALAGQDIVIREAGSVTREVFEARLADHGIRPGVLLDVQGREAVREAVAAGFGIGIVFDSEFAADPAFRTVAFQEDDLVVAEYVACLESRRRLPMVRSFLALVPQG